MTHCVSVKHLSIHLQTDFRIMRKYCCSECLDKGAVISDHDEAECFDMASSITMDIYEDAKMDIYEEYMTVKGKIYEYLVCAAYKKYDIPILRQENAHPLPLGVETKLFWLLGRRPPVWFLFCERLHFNRFNKRLN